MQDTIELAGLQIDPRWAGMVALGWLGVGAIGWVVYARWSNRRASRRRVRESDDALGSDAAQVAVQLAAQADDVGRGLTRWLFLANYRGRAATGLFVVATLVGVGVGAALGVFLATSGMIDELAATAGGVPGGLGDLAVVVLQSAPWLLLVLLALLPMSIVRSRRRRRVLEVEQDLPITLELLATMSESGLAFDSALARALEAQRKARPLSQELETFQVEALAGVSRVRCFRRLARRLEVQSVSIFVSALVQAEQVGAGFAGVLRTQADDLRNRRRERAASMAEALPVKLIFPLVLCFLPGIFVTTLGPTFMQFIKLADGMAGR